MSLQYLIDTDWVIHYLHAHPAIVARLDELHPQGLALSIVSLAELYEGVYPYSDTCRTCSSITKVYGDVKHYFPLSRVPEKPCFSVGKCGPHTKVKV
jgi:hypothetical protein